MNRIWKIIHFEVYGGRIESSTFGHEKMIHALFGDLQSEGILHNRFNLINSGIGSSNECEAIKDLSPTPKLKPNLLKNQKTNFGKLNVNWKKCNMKSWSIPYHFILKTTFLWRRGIKMKNKWKLLIMKIWKSMAHKRFKKNLRAVTCQNSLSWNYILNII